MSKNFDITQATVLSVSQEPVRFDSDFRFGTRTNLTVEVVELDASNIEGVGACAEAADDLRKKEDWLKLTVNGTSISGRAKLTDFNLEEGTWVTYTKATLGFQIYDEGDLDTYLAGEYYKGLEKIKDTGEFLEDFSEDFNFNRSNDSTTYTYSLTLKFSPAAQVTSTDDCLPGEIATAYQCAAEIIKGEASSRPSFALIDDELKDLYSTYGKGNKRTLRESVDIINKTCTFTEEFTAYNITDAPSYSTIIRQSLTLSEEGIVDIREDGTLLGLPAEGDEIQRQMPAVEGEINQALDATINGRLVKIFNAYKVNWSCEGMHDLIKDPDDATKLLFIKKGRKYDSFKGESGYEIVVTNNPKYLEYVVHDYTVSTEAVQGEKGNIYRATEAGTITGKTQGEIDSDKDDDGKISWQQVLAYWKKFVTANGFVKHPAGVGGAKSLITDILRTPSPRLVTNSTTKSPWKVQISYSQSVSEEVRYKDNDGVAKSLTFKENKGYSVQKHKVASVINHPQQKQLLQSRETASRNSISAQIEVVGKRQSTLNELLDLAKNKLEDAAEWPSDAKPQDSYTYIDGAGYSFTDDNDIKLNVNIGWK